MAMFRTHAGNYFKTLQTRLRHKDKRATSTYQSKIRERRVAVRHTTLRAAAVARLGVISFHSQLACCFSSPLLLQKRNQRVKTTALWYDTGKKEGIPIEADSVQVIPRSKLEQLFDDRILFISEDEDPVPPTLKEQEELDRAGLVIQAPLRRLKLPWRSEEADRIIQQIDTRAPDLLLRGGRPLRKVVASCGQSAPPTPAQIKKLLHPDLAWAVDPTWLLEHQQTHQLDNESLLVQDPNEPGGSTTVSLGKR